MKVCFSNVIWDSFGWTWKRITGRQSLRTSWILITSWFCFPSFLCRRRYSVPGWAILSWIWDFLRPRWEKAHSEFWSSSSSTLTTSCFQGHRPYFVIPKNKLIIHPPARSSRNRSRIFYLVGFFFLLNVGLNQWWVSNFTSFGQWPLPITNVKSSVFLLKSIILI